MKKILRAVENSLRWLYFETMAYPHTPELQLPFDGYRANSYQFRQICSYNGRLWGMHLGEDCNEVAGRIVRAVGQGKVVYSNPHPGSKGKSNWGNIIIVAHKHPKTKKVFFSIYGHLGRRFVKKGNTVTMGQKIGTIGRANTPGNGMWEDAHLHLAIYTGPWLGKVLPGYWRKDQKLTRPAWWQEPSRFIHNYKS